MIQAIDYDSPSFLKTFMDARGMAMQKKFGQNFLVNPSARAKIADGMNLERGMRVWEIGPGLGALTFELLKRGAFVTAFEIDRGFIQVLETVFPDEISQNRLKIVAGDVLKTWKTEYDSGAKADCLCGNLPYNIAAKIVADTVSESVRFNRCVFTVQKEVGQRMTAKTGSPLYSSFSVLCRWAYDIKPLMDLAAGSFWPRPNVASQVLTFTPAADFPACKSTERFLTLQRALFSSRRKTVKNNLTALYKDAEKAELILKRAGIQPADRAENLSVADILGLADSAYEYESKGHTDEQHG